MLAVDDRPYIVGFCIYIYRNIWMRFYVYVHFLIMFDLWFYVDINIEYYVIIAQRAVSDRPYMLAIRAVYMKPRYVGNLCFV